MNLHEGKCLVQYGKPVTIDFSQFKKKIDQVGFTLDRLEIEGFGRVVDRQGKPVLVLDKSWQVLPVRVTPILEDLLAVSKGELVWVRGYVHGRGEGAKLHLSLNDWRSSDSEGDSS